MKRRDKNSRDKWEPVKCIIYQKGFMPTEKIWRFNGSLGPSVELNIFGVGKVGFVEELKGDRQTMASRVTWKASAEK